MAPDDLLAPLIADAADRTGVAPDTIEVRSSERMTWPNGALGCPEPGQAYTQALVEGYRVVLVAGTTTYDYRAPDAGAFKLCERPAPQASGADFQPFPDRTNGSSG